MTTSLLLTKVERPPLRPNLVPRSVLIERLNDGLRSGARLTLVAAPAGFGKTTLVAEWAEHAHRPFAWLSLDQGDNDPVCLLTYIVAALQTVDDRLGRSVQSLIQSLRLPAGVSMVETAATPGPMATATSVPRTAPSSAAGAE